ncbi:MAG: 30S ribosomal protein S16 [Bacteroidota bacterium]
MPTRIRLQRKGKKGNPFYHLVVADGRAPRDGKFIEKLGTYNPLTHPATIEINFDRALYWLQVGAQPSDTARSILSREGVLLKEHLLRGVKKGALTEDQVEEKFQAWLKEKSQKLEQAAKETELSEKELKKKRLEEERKISEARAEELAKKLAKENLKEEKAETEAEAEETTEEPAAEDTAEEKKEE